MHGTQNPRQKSVVGTYPDPIKVNRAEQHYNTQSMDKCATVVDKAAMSG